MSVKNLKLNFIDSKSANQFVKRWHYSGKIVANSQIHVGVFDDKKLAGVLSYGASMDKRRMIKLVNNTSWNGFLELNRMAFADYLPKNSESRSLAISFKMIKKKFPFIDWIVTFADACQCGDGTIYRAVGFKLINIKKNKTLIQLPDGQIIADKSINDLGRESIKICQRYDVDINKGFKIKGQLLKKGAKPLVGYQIKYIYFLNKEKEKDLTVDLMPYSEIGKIGASMYKGKSLA